MPLLNLTAKEIHIIVQALRIAIEFNDDEIKTYAKPVELSQLRNKLQNIKDV
jgi:hypothetical protein